MRTWGLVGVAALGLAVATAPAQQAGRPAASAEQPGWWSGLFGGKPKEEPKKPAPRPAQSQEARAAELDKLQRAYQRREAVCDRLREIALATNDAALELEASQLLEMAMKLYQERSNKLLGVASMTMEDEPTTSRPTRVSAPSRSGPLPPRLRSNGSLRPESNHPTAPAREGDR